MLSEITNTVASGKIKDIEAIIGAALAADEKPQIILDAMTNAMTDIGEKFQLGELFIPEMFAAALTMKKGVALLKPYLAGENAVKIGKFIIGTVAGDMHDIGKNLVALMLESAGFEVLDLGVDVSPEKFIDAIIANPDCKLLGLSTLLTTTMQSMKAIVEAIEKAGLRDKIKIMCGGAPVTNEFAAEIGADAYTPDAGSAAIKARELAL